MIFRVEAHANCEDLRSRTVKFADDAFGEKTAKSIISVSGKEMGGDLTPYNVRQFFFEAAVQALNQVVAKLGSYYPVGGPVTAFFGNSLKLDRGFLHGIDSGSDIIVYTPVDGVDIPLALGKTEPADAYTTIRVCHWNVTDPYVKVLIDGMHFDHDWLKKHDCYAVVRGQKLHLELNHE